MTVKKAGSELVRLRANTLRFDVTARDLLASSQNYEILEVGQSLNPNGVYLVAEFNGQYTRETVLAALMKIKTFVETIDQLGNERLVPRVEASMVMDLQREVANLAEMIKGLPPEAQKWVISMLPRP